jgi:hypothetical protein
MCCFIVYNLQAPISTGSYNCAAAGTTTATPPVVTTAVAVDQPVAGVLVYMCSTPIFGPQTPSETGFLFFAESARDAQNSKAHGRASLKKNVGFRKKLTPGPAIPVLGPPNPPETGFLFFAESARAAQNSKGHGRASLTMNACF